ncbi:MAG: Gfo/Idh/MocA family oxidoreductase [Planctomycetaceae bacterium]|nr:Gfo/Idh/MocA family oxidoreductase [Planctomycetaceae bacterium]
MTSTEPTRRSSSTTNADAIESSAPSTQAIPLGDRPVRVAILGCGQIADAHLGQLQRIRFAEVVGVCDSYEDLAYQAGVRFNVPQFTDLDNMLQVAQPDVVHIATPAHTHAPLAIKLLHAGCHVYVEKPFTLDVAEADRVIEVAANTGRRICIGHDQLFDPMWLRARQLVQSGAIGEARHVESILGYPIDGKFGALVKGDPNHWVRKLPGGLFQNTISHPLYRITDLLPDAEPVLLGNWLRRGGLDFPTELHIALEGEQVAGSLTFSTHLPPQRITRIYGTRGHLAIDFDGQVIRRAARPRMPGAFAKLEMPWRGFWDSCGNLGRNMWRFACGDIHYFAGMKNLFEAFYRSLQQGTEPPIPVAEIRRVTGLMDRIFEHCRSQDSQETT